MKKTLAWYNLLLEKEIMDFSEEEASKEPSAEEPGIEVIPEKPSDALW